MGSEETSIRAAANDDVAAMLAIYRPVVEETSISFELTVPTLYEFSKRVRRITTTYPWLVIEAHNQILGYAYATSFRDRAAYNATAETAVYVQSDHQKQGMGSALMEALLNRLAVNGIHRAIAGITLPNESSVGLHESLGFAHVGTFSEVGWKFGEWHDIGFWELALDAR